MLDGKEFAFWGSASDKPHTWHEELWATLESRVMEGLLSGQESPAAASAANGSGALASSASSNGRSSKENGAAPAAAMVAGDNARALARQEWNKARAVATTSEVFKAMSRTGAGGDAYFSLVALFCTADKLVVPVNCQESPITVEFLNRPGSGGRGGGGRSHRYSKARGGGKNGSKGAAAAAADDVHVLVTVPSTFDIYLRDGAVATGGAEGGGSRKSTFGNGSAHARGSSGGGGKMRRKGSTSSTHSNGDGAAATDASVALHLVRVKAVVEEEIRVVGSSKVPASSSHKKGGRSGSKSGSASANGAAADDAPPTLRFLLDPARDDRRTSLGSTPADGRRLSNGRLSSAARGRAEGPTVDGARGGRAAAGGPGASAGVGELSMSPPPPAPAPLLALTRTERRLALSVVPEPNAVSELVRSFSRKMGVDVAAPQPPRVLGR